jgi:hypothetical protein
MTFRSFTCENELCGRFREGVMLDNAFSCRHKGCLGQTLLLTPPALPARPFWKSERFLGAMILIMVAGFVLALLIRTAPPKLADVSPPGVENGVLRNDPRFEVHSLVASAENLLRLWRAKLVAQDAAQTKWVNGQRVTPDGRTSDEALDRVKLTYEEQRRFADIVQQKEKEILAEASRYEEIIQRVTSFPPATIRAVFDSLRQSNNVSPREELAIGLAERHAFQQREGRLVLKTVYSEYENAALR